MKKIFLRMMKYALIAVVFFALLILVLWLYPLAEPLTQKSSDHSYIIKGVNIVDAEADTVLHNQFVYIKGDRIERIASDAFTPDDANMVQVEGTGKYLIPGLWDMHSHLAFQIAPQVIMPLHIAHGVTNIRDMQGIVNINEERRQWRQDILAEKLLGPRLIGFADEIVGANYDEQDVVEVVNRTAADPNTFIKIYSGILSERYFALAKEANARGVVFAGHYPNAINPIDASNAGQRSFEHAHLFIKHANPLADQNREYYRALYSDEEVDASDRPSVVAMLEGFDEEQFNELVDVMVKNETYFCPTHVTRRYEALAYDQDFLDDPNLQYVPPLVAMIWSDDASGMHEYAKPDGMQTYLEDFYTKGLELTGRAHDSGVKVLAGTDSYDPYSFPGISLHQELEELVKAGLTPAEALVSATSEPAVYFGVTADYGRVEAGKVADLLLLSKNPLEDIRNTRTIERLYYNGNQYEKTDLEAMKTYVADNASGIKGWALSVKMFLRLMKDNRH
ncbi:amidohydrolase family protein [Marinoscillum furvescens]|nr:amidohydrolase family protein [Marinoscillum furvescens]